MEPITDDRLRRLMVALHGAIAESSASCAGKLADGSVDADLAYPPGATLAGDELAALRALAIDEHAAQGLQKVVADSMSLAFFIFFNLMDATGDPADGVEGTWLGAELAEPTLDYRPMLHDAFFETYWDFAE
jgi:hypothetical protein